MQSRNKSDRRGAERKRTNDHFLPLRTDPRRKDTRRYGLTPDGKILAQREVAEKLDISRSYVSRIEKSALDKLNRIKQSKKRKFYSLIFKDLSDIARYADIDNRHFSLLKRCLPGAYTFILTASREIPKIMLENRKEIGIRIPEL